MAFEFLDQIQGHGTKVAVLLTESGESVSYECGICIANDVVRYPAPGPGIDLQPEYGASC